MYGKNTDEEVQSIIDEAQGFIKASSSKENLKKCYDRLQDGLRKYPNNILLLRHSLDSAVSLAYPESPFYDETEGENIYKRSIREANIVVKNGTYVMEKLRAHSIMVILHSAYGNYEEAFRHAEVFPWRSDLTIQRMKAFIFHWKKNYTAENKFCQYDLMFRFQSCLDELVNIGRCYCLNEEYEKAECAYVQALDLIELICKHEDTDLFFHLREQGDIYILLAEVLLKQSKNAEAVDILEKMVDCDLSLIKNYVFGKRMNSPVLCMVGQDYYLRFDKHKEKLLFNCKDKVLLKLKAPVFDDIRSDERFTALCKRVSECLQDQNID